MSQSVFLSAIWAIAATLVALLPMRYQYAPGIALLLAAPFLLVLLAQEHSVWIMLLSLAAVISLFRKPLMYFYRRAMGLPPRRPDNEAENQ